MIENKAWFVTKADHGLGVEIATAEPSHIHVPRPSRALRPDSAATGAPSGSHLADEVCGEPPADR